MNPSIYIYLDGFRGFSQTVFQLKDVNFFVGENSTGKTSVLALLNSILSSGFWFNQQFNNNQEYDFGGFRDMLSASLPDDGEFTFGVYHVDQKEEEKKQITGFLASFRDHEGLPLCSFFATVDGTNLNAIRTNQFETYQFCNYQIPSDSLGSTAVDVFEYIQNWRSDPTIIFKDIDAKFAQGIGLVLMMQIAATVEAGKSDSKGTSHEFSMTMPPFLRNVTWLAPIRTRPHRTYDGYMKDFSPEGEHTPFVLRKRLGSARDAKAFEAALKKFGKASGLFKKVSVHSLGKGAADPFEILVTLSSKALRIDSVGYGISQVLPLLVEILIRPKKSWFAIQQPEVHLHPKAQAALGDLIFHVSKDEEKRFLIETHSDFTIDRFRLNFRAGNEAKIESQVLFFERSGEGNRLSSVPIMPNGEFSEDQPNTFREFFLKEQIHILGI